MATRELVTEGTETPERSQRVRAVFHAAIARPPDERGRFIAEACGDDTTLAAEVEARLAAHADAPTANLLAETAGPPREAADPRTGRRIGPYEIVRRLGEGGMGVVYLARRADGQYGQDVAIKIVKRGMDTDFVLRRFRGERQILANLTHPNIARILDGGADESGLPYVVMEYIDGQPIDAYCRERGLSVRARLALFLDACGAVQHAHRNLVVHRDIKPANLLVTAAGEAKLLDFGIAKLLEPDADATQPHVRLMTPAYASPEQLRGQPVTTASDVHALGILLYELLTGRHPYARDDLGTEELERVIREDEPPRPSTVCPARLRRAIAGDLDNIALMALRKDPARRYGSAEQLAEDLRRHLAGRPVIARKDTLAYRTGKLLRRHWLPLGALALVLATLVAGIAATAWQARIADAERARAERRFSDVRRMANSMVFELHDAIAALPGATPARKLLVARALAYLDGLTAEAGGDAGLLRELSVAYRKLGDVMGHAGMSNLGDADGALASYRKGLALAEAALANDPGDLEARHEVALQLDRVGDVLFDKGDLDGCLEQARASSAAYEILLAARRDDVGVLQEAAGIRVDIGDVLMMRGERAKARASYEEALARHEEIRARGLEDAPARRARSIVWNKIGDLRAAEKDTAGALAAYREALRLREGLLSDQPESAVARRDLSTSLSKVGRMLWHQDKVDEALAMYERGMAIDLAQLAADPQDVRARRDVAVMATKIGEVHHNRALEGPPGEAVRGHWRAARARYAEALETYVDLERKGQHRAQDAGLPDKLREMIAKCDAGLAAGP